ncbi:MAG: CRISPR-associated endonuclease Cas2 [Gammaproteobacteria bacterium]|nr:CRISPR-associated endonuclease Cas2 [Gammaproteobacteria bacterium]
MARDLFLVAYDVRNPKRLRRVHQVLKEFACGGQKSAFECYLTNSERKELVGRVEDCINLKEDAFLVIQLVSRDAVSTLGIAMTPADELFTYLG